MNDRLKQTIKMSIIANIFTQKVGAPKIMTLALVLLAVLYVAGGIWFFDVFLQTMMRLTQKYIFTFLV